MKYNELNDDYVLKDVSFSIKAGEKVGCVGRTGAGKSSLILSLFRMVDIDVEKSSKILIDNVNIQSVGLLKLRQNIAIIPQTAFIFVGPIRYNLDPLSEHSDERLWEVLREV